MSIRYINDRFLPDKAIDIIDEACARAKIRCSSIVKKETDLIEVKSGKLSVKDVDKIIRNGNTFAEEVSEDDAH